MKKSKKWLHPKILCPENTLKVKSMVFADVLDVGYERNRRLNFDLSNWNTVWETFELNCFRNFRGSTKCLKWIKI